MIPKQNLSRRRFIAGGAALAALPLLSHRSAATEVDVVVVGAGAAGLAATRDLHRPRRRQGVVGELRRVGESSRWLCRRWQS